MDPKAKTAKTAKAKTAKANKKDGRGNHKTNSDNWDLDVDDTSGDSFQLGQAYRDYKNEFDGGLDPDYKKRKNLFSKKKILKMICPRTLRWLKTY